MVVTLGLQVLVAAIFGLVVAGVGILIEGTRPFPVRHWLALAWVLACLCYIVLYGVIAL